MIVKRCLRWIWAHRLVSCAVCLALGVVAFNAIVYMHARAMMRFAAADGVRTENPERLSFPQRLKVLLTGVTIPRPENRTTPDRFGLVFETCRFAGDRGQLEAWYIPGTEQRGIVLMFHGYASCKSALLPEASAIHDLGYATFLVDFCGSGGSDGNITTVGVEESTDVLSSLRYVQEHWHADPVIVFGQSMGSTAILRSIAVQHSSPDAVILECPFDRLVTTAQNRFHSMHLPGTPFAQILVFWGGVQQGFNGFEHNPVDYARSVTVPALMLHGSVDPRVTLPQAEQVFANLAGAKQLVVFDGLGHESYVASQPDQWKLAVGNFLAEMVHE